MSIAARVDGNGYFWIQGRLDDVLNVAGHRIGNNEVGSALVSHLAIIVAFVVLRRKSQPSEELKAELREHVAKEIGKLTHLDVIYFVPDLPKTRSGKIMRRLVRAKLTKERIEDTSTLMNPEALVLVEKAIEGD